MNRSTQTLVVLPFIFSSLLFAAEPSPVRVVSVNGGVKVAGRSVTPGAKLKAGDKIVTEADGSAKLLYPDKSLLDVGPSTVFLIKSISNEGGGVGEMSSGMVRALIKKKLENKSDFIIQTKTSVLAVRGTEFTVNLTPGSDGVIKETVTVGEGLVDMKPVRGASADIIQLGAGQRAEQFVTPAGQPAPATGPGREVASAPAGQPKVTNLKPEEIKMEIDRAKVNDQTFENFVHVVPGDRPGDKPVQGAGTIGAMVAEFKPPPPFKGEEVDKAVGEFKVRPPVRPPEPSPIQSLNPEISEQLPVGVTVKFTPP